MNKHSKLISILLKCVELLFQTELVLGLFLQVLIALQVHDFYLKKQQQKKTSQIASLEAS